MKRRHFIILLGGASASALSVGTGAFSSAQAGRGVDVSVVDDDNAYVGYEVSDPKTVSSDGEEVVLVTVANRFRQDISIVDVEVEAGTDILRDVSYSNSAFGSGETADVTARVCGMDPEDVVGVEVTVTVEGSGVTAQLFGDTKTRRFTIEREIQEDSPQDCVEFFGSGDAEILGTDRTDTVDVYLLGSDNGDDVVIPVENVEVDTKKKIRGQMDGAGGNTIVGVTLDNTVYVHPQWNPDVCGLEQSTNGGLGVSSDTPPSCETS